MFQQKKSTVTSGNPTWSMHTPYTSVTGIHSEIQPGANARNSLIHRKISDTMTTVESIHRKDLQSMAFHKKSIENSMLTYTEKVKSIAERRPSQLQLAEKRSSFSNNDQESEKQIVRKFSVSGTRQELFGKKALLPPIHTNRKDNEVEKNKLSVTDVQENKPGTKLTSGNSMTYRRKRRFGVYENPQLKDENDKENYVRDESRDHIEQNVSIAPFPERSQTFLNYVTVHKLDNDPVHRETPAPFIKPGYWSYRIVHQTKKQLPLINTETGSSKVRRSKRRLRPIITTPAKPYHQVFTYSSAVQTALLGLGNADLVIDKKKNIFKSRAELQSIDLEDVKMAHSLRSIQECVEPESLQVQ